MFYGAQLQSIVVITDAHCSRCTGYVSACVALALLIQGVVWWADSALGLLLACYIIFDGVSNMQAARAEWQTLKDAPGAAPTNGTGGARSEPLLSAPERDEFAQEQGHMGSQSIVF
ncbi:hypothetical protein JKP88DRAFT_231522 [Tribonema minus]|uniref:Uncharacterized protein n=1 Tax=Tribonema minus TaxID=303371 RepID=A0A836CMU9_9STRA|nr:hypothetical protein JKP88DRAFT_231522 [Tribonema minus]